METPKMLKPVTRQELAGVAKRLERRIDRKIDRKIDRFALRVAKRFDGVDRRLDRVETEVARIKDLPTRSEISAMFQQIWGKLEAMDRTKLTWDSMYNDHERRITALERRPS